LSDTHEDPTAPAQRLETALERIALAVAQSMAQSGAQSGAAAPPGAAAQTPEAAQMKARLDALIARLRAGLGEKRG
jgi:hypothetical protein